MASIWPSIRCSSPQVTTCSTASKTFSQEVRNASAVSFQERWRPTGEEEHIGFGQRAFAVGPGNLFDDDGAAASAIDATHGIQQEDEKSPQGNELKASFGELIVAASRMMAARTDRGRPLARPHQHLDTLAVRTEAGAMIYKSPEPMTAV